MHDAGAHDEINLARLVRRLEKTTTHREEWKNVEASEDTFLNAEGILQRVKFARKLLKNCEQFSGDDEKKTRLLSNWRLKLDHVETTMKDISERARPQPRPIPQFLSSIPMTPSDSAPLPPAELPSALPKLLPSHFTPSASTSDDATAVATGASRFRHTSNALQQELSDQLAQMAVQLKRNALHFSDTLVKDKAVVEEAQQKLESNFDIMQKERIRLRDHRGKSGSTTCMVVAIIVAAVLLFALMVILIRLTRVL